MCLPPAFRACTQHPLHVTCAWFRVFSHASYGKLFVFVVPASDLQVAESLEPSSVRAGHLLLAPVQQSHLCV